MIVKTLGGIDLVAAVVFLTFAFGAELPVQFVLFAAGLIGVKGLFALTGDVLSFPDLGACVILIILIYFSLPSILIWIPALLLLAKGTVSFM